MPLDLFGDDSGLPLTTRSGIAYEVDAFDYREQWVRDSSRTTVLCRVRASEAFNWVTDMVGRVYVANSGGVNRLRRDLPEVNPFDGKQYCTGVVQADQGGPPTGGTQTVDGRPSFADPVSGWPVTRWMRYRATFEGMPHEMRDDGTVDGLPGERELGRYVVRSRKTFSREQQIPGGAFQIINDGDPNKRFPLLNTSFKSIVFGDVTYTWMRFPVGKLPAAADAHQGKVNSVTFDAKGPLNEAGYTFDAGTLLYSGYDDTNKYYDANEDWVSDVVFSFRFKQIGWNKYLTKNGTEVEVSTEVTPGDGLAGTSGGRRPYASADFHELFRVD